MRDQTSITIVRQAAGWLTPVAAMVAPAVAMTLPTVGHPDRVPDAAAPPIGHSPKPSGLHSSSKSRPPRHILDRARSQRRPRRRVLAEGARYTPRIRPCIRRRKPPSRTMPKESPKELQISCPCYLLTALDGRDGAMGCDGEKSITLGPIHVSRLLRIALLRNRDRNRPGCRLLARPLDRRTPKHSP